MFDKPILIIGVGSIGERHILNLKDIGFRNIHVFRKRNLPFRSVQKEDVHLHLLWHEIIDLKPYAVIITTPTSLHLSYAIECAKLGSHLLIEKPLSDKTNGINELIDLVSRNNIYVKIAYMLRYHPLLEKLKSIICAQSLGRLVSYSSKWSEYLPNWHPWEDYRNSYAANKDLGGGAALTLSHDIDLANWLVNSRIINFFIQKNYICNLEINVDGGADILIKYENGVTCNIQLNFFEHESERYLKLFFANGSAHFDYYQNKLIIVNDDEIETFYLEKFERNDMFKLQLVDFFRSIEHSTINESLTNINESLQIINICNGNK